MPEIGGYISGVEVTRVVESFFKQQTANIDFTLARQEVELPLETVHTYAFYSLSCFAVLPRAGSRGNDRVLCVVLRGGTTCPLSGTVTS